MNRRHVKSLAGWAVTFLIITIGIPIAIAQWGSFSVYSVYLNLIVVFGLACSLFVTLTWTPKIIRAYRRGRLNVSPLAIVDFATLAYLGTLVFGLRLVLTIMTGTPVPENAGRGVLNLAVWTLIAIKVGLRAYVWRRAMLRGPDALDDVTDRVRGPVVLAAEEMERDDDRV